MNYANKWALITGASAGIGACFARRLAEAGANLVLVARRQDRLEALANELEKAYDIRALVFAADLADEEAPSKIWHYLKGQSITVDILINNAGYGLPGYYLDHDWKKHKDFIALMMTSYAHLSHLLIPAMQARGYGRVIQVASVAGLVPPAAGHTLYGATKSFLVGFAQSLHLELRGSGVHVSALCPGFTLSEFHDVNGTRDAINALPKFMVCSADYVVAGALRAVENNKPVYVPGLVYKALTLMSQIMPRSWALAISGQTTKGFRRRLNKGENP